MATTTTMPEPETAIPPAAEEEPVTMTGPAPETSHISTAITLRAPTKYAQEAGTNTITTTTTTAAASPPLDFLFRTWSVTHSTLKMWGTAQNVRITYSPLPPKKRKGGVEITRIDDLVEYEVLGGRGSVKSVAGIDTATTGAAAPGDKEASPAQPPANTSWKWRGKGFLFLTSSHWEILGWGERPVTTATGEVEVERWVVTWFAATLVSAEGIDIYCDRKGGVSKETEMLIREALTGIGVKHLVEMVEKDMRPVHISLPWKER